MSGPQPADTTKTCPLCGSLARYFGRSRRGVWTCTAAKCGQMFERVVSPRRRGDVKPSASQGDTPELADASNRSNGDMIEPTGQGLLTPETPSRRGGGG